MDVTAYIGLGSNLGDGLQTLQRAWEEIGRTTGVTTVAMSAPFLSAPVGMTSSNWFTNSVGELKTDLAPFDLLDLLMNVEHSFGRRRESSGEGYQDRTLDLDILYFGEMAIKSSRLTLPHPFLAERLFVLEPLAQIAPLFKDPVDGLTPGEKLEDLHRQMRLGTIARQEISRGKWPAFLRHEQE
ncbi:MAG: 2-amino-4-hydroxy-6-hydroxymethyldihydropteridine diphosphokinase [Desulfopila sp.]|nr:2-amino-4-hydroxy-6-hydroxymethyldihydropteridine diphosphokinase [Desulfopila sp.]